MTNAELQLENEKLKEENFKFHFELKRQEKIIEIITGNEKRVRYTSYIPIFYYDLEWED